jgi:hypothetical protein
MDERIILKWVLNGFDDVDRIRLAQDIVGCHSVANADSEQKG